MLNRLFASRKRPFLAGLNKPQHIEMDISGSKLELDVPAHNDASLPEQQAPLSHFNLYTTEGFDPDDGTFSTALLMGRDLDLYAAPFGLSSSMGTISVKVAIDRVDCLPEGMTCLNPEHFEQVVIRLVYDMGPGSGVFREVFADKIRSYRAKRAVPISIDDILTAYRDYEQKAFVESLLQIPSVGAKLFRDIVRG